jgi:L,D-transpeptidase catalytic domain/Sporulation and spore germination/Putative peptidoglycan binding domain
MQIRQHTDKACVSTRRTSVITMRVVLGVVAVAAALALAPSAGAATLARAWFPQGDQLRYGIRVTDDSTPVRTALRSLLAGPEPAESRAGARTAFARGTRLLGFRREGPLVTIQLDRRFLLQTATGTTRVSQRRLRVRLLQLGRTLQQFPSVRRFRISVSSQLLRVYPELGMRWLPSATGVWELGQLTPQPSFPLATRPTQSDLTAPAEVRLAQSLLAGAGWLDPGDVTGVVDYTTSQALIAFESWNGLPRDGQLTPDAFGRILRATRPAPRHSGAGRFVEIYRDLGVLLLVENGRVARAVHTSTGTGGRTPSGAFHVYRKERLSWSVPFEVWMPFASYFVGGIAMHAYPYVPAYPASHGCVRLPAPEAPRVYAFALDGVPVYVF